MKKLLFMISLMIIIMTLTLAGCGGDKPPTYGPWLRVHVEAQTNTIVAWGFLDSDDNTNLNANITVDGILINEQNMTTIPLHEGETFDIIATHSTIGTIKRTFTFPNTVTNVHTHQSLADWIARTLPTLTLEWDNGDGDYYFINGHSGANYPWIVIQY